MVGASVLGAGVFDDGGLTVKVVVAWERTVWPDMGVAIPCVCGGTKSKK